MKSKNRPVIAGIGERLWDMFPTGKKAGGALVDFAYHASDSGAESYTISAIGNDNPGEGAHHSAVSRATAVCTVAGACTKM